MTAVVTGADARRTVNRRIWSRDRLDDYVDRSLRFVETSTIERYRSELSGQVLEIGCGGGAILGHLVALGGDVHGIDISPTMVEFCRRRWPSADLRVRDMRDLDEWPGDAFDAVVAADNVLDILEAGERARVLASVRSLLAPGGLLIFAAHNLDRSDEATRHGWPARPGNLGRRLRAVVPSGRTDLKRRARRLQWRLTTWRRLRDLEFRGADYAILNDAEGGHEAMHYYVTRDAQERQLAAAGLELIECLEVDGTVVAPGRPGVSPWLHYVARRSHGLPG